MAQIILFLIAIGIGAALRVVYFLCAAVAKSTRIKAMNYIMDIFFCCVGFAAFLPYLVFLADGKIEAFMIVGLAAGLLFCSIPFSFFRKKPKQEKPEAEIPDKENTEKTLTKSI